MKEGFQGFGSKVKEGLVKIATLVGFHSSLLGVFSGFASNFEIKRNVKGEIAVPIIKKRRSHNLQIFVYHRVNDERDPFFSATPIQIFSKQMEYLASNFNLLPLESAIERMNHEELPPNAVVLTFDDGYKDIYLNAFPVLRKLSVPGTVFLATGAIGTGELLWHDKVFSAFRQTRVPSLDEFGANAKSYSLRSVQEKLFAQREALRFLRSLDGYEREIWIRRLIAKLSVDKQESANDLMLTWEEVKVMHSGGITFGSHTVTHPILSRTSLIKVQEEVEESKRVIEQQLGSPVKSFAYPNGERTDFSEETKVILRKSGFTCAVTTIFGTNSIDQDLFELRRGGPWEEHLPTFAVKSYWFKFAS